MAIPSIPSGAEGMYRKPQPQRRAEDEQSEAEDTRMPGVTLYGLKSNHTVAPIQAGDNPNPVNTAPRHSIPRRAMTEAQPNLPSYPPAMGFPMSSAQSGQRQGAKPTPFSRSGPHITTQPSKAARPADQSNTHQPGLQPPPFPDKHYPPSHQHPQPRQQQTGQYQQMEEPQQRPQQPIPHQHAQQFIPRPPSRATSQTSRSRSQSLAAHRTSHHNMSNVDLHEASRLRAKTPLPQPRNMSDSSNEQQRGRTIQRQSSPSSPDTPISAISVSTPKYYADRPDQVFLPLRITTPRPGIDQTPPSPKPSYPNYHSLVHDDLSVERQPPPRPSTSASSRPMKRETSMPPPTIPSLVDNARAAERMLEETKQELAECQEELAKCEARTEDAKADNTHLQQKIEDLEDLVAQVNKSKAQTVENAKRAVNMARQKVTDMESQHYNILELQKSPLSSELEELKHEYRKLQSSIGHSSVSPESGEEDNQENQASPTGLPSYRDLVKSLEDETRRSRDVIEIAKKATAELSESENLVISLRSEHTQTSVEVILEKGKNASLTERNRDLEQRCSEMSKRLREESEISAAQIKGFKEEQWQSLPDREIAVAVRLELESQIKIKTKELEACNKNLSSLQEHFDTTHEQLNTSIDLLKRAGIVSEEGTYDESVIEAIEGQKEKYESEIEDLRTSLGEAAEEIKKTKAELTEALQAAELAASQRGDVDSSTNEIVIRLQAKVQDLESKLEDAKKETAKVTKEWRESEECLGADLQQFQNNEKVAIARESKMQESINQMTNALKKEEAEKKALKDQLAFTAQENDRLQAELSKKTKSVSPSSFDKERANLIAETTRLRSEANALQAVINTKDSELAAADEGAIDRKEEIERLAKNKEVLEDEIREARERIENLIKVADNDSTTTTTQAERDREYRRLKDEMFVLKKRMVARTEPVKERFNTDRLTAEEEEAVTIALEEQDALHATSISERDAKFKELKQTEERLRAEIFAAQKAIKASKKQNATAESDLSSPPTADQPSTSKAAASASTSKKPEAAPSRANKKTRFDSETLHEHDRSTAIPTATSKKAATANTNKQTQARNLQATNSTQDSIQQFSSPARDEVGTSIQKAKTQGKKRRAQESDDDYEQVKAGPLTSKAAKPAPVKKAPPKNKPTKAAAKATTGTARQTRAATRTPSIQLPPASIQLPVVTQNPDKLRGLKNQARVEDEVDELADDWSQQ